MTWEGSGRDPLLDRFSAFDTGVISDALDRLGMTGVVNAVTRLAGDANIVGYAVTVQLAPDDGSPSLRHLCATAIHEGDEQSVIVVAGGLETCGGWGGLLSHAASYKGIRGAIVDGATRDVDEANELGFPVFARRASPSTVRGRQREIASQVRVVIDEVAVNPGDLIVADGTGIVVVPRARAAEVATVAGEIAERERAMASRLASGETVTSVLAGVSEIL